MISFSWASLLYLVIGFICLDVMIIVHELGHFAACRLTGVKVKSLSVGFGPVIYKWGKGETKYQICAIPVGGSTQMLGQDDLKNAIEKGEKKITQCEEGSLYAASNFQKILIYLSGPVANILFAILCYTVFLCIPILSPSSPSRIVVSSDYPALYSIDCPASEAGLKTGDLILSVDGVPVKTYAELSKALSELKDNKTVFLSTEKGTYSVHPADGVFGILPYRETAVGAVSAASAEQFAGLKAGDVIVGINGKEVSNMFDLLNEVEQTSSISLSVVRSGAIHNVSFRLDEKKLHFTLKQQTVRTEGDKFSQAFVKACRQCLSETKQFFSAIILLFEGKLKLSETIGGSIAASENMGMLATKAFDTSFNTGIRVVLYIIASVSMSLAVANFLPITALDGGLILINLIEMITRRSFSPKTYVVFQVLGLLIMFGVIPLIKIFY